MRAYFAKAGDRLAPADARAEKMLRELGDGEALMFAIVKVRSLDWHNMYFAICREIGENSDPWRSEKSIDRELRIRAGHFDVMFIDGLEVRYAKSISFENMAADEWAQLWPSLDLAMQEHFGFDFEAWKATPRPSNMPQRRCT